ncbi:MAG: histidine kinase [Kibdelosporangium sp.]
MRSSRVLRAPDRRLTELRHDIERALHDDVAIGMSALTIELDLIAVAASDPAVGARIDAVRTAVCRVIEELRQVGSAIYPPALGSVDGLGAALRAVAERRHLKLRLDLPPHELTAEARIRTGLLVADHMLTLPPGTEVGVRVRGRRFLRVHVIEQRADRRGRHHLRAVLRCG